MSLSSHRHTGYGRARIWRRSVLLTCLVAIPSLGSAADPPPGPPAAKWIGKNSAAVLLGWSAPSVNEDGTSPVADLAGYRLYYGAASRPYPTVENMLTETTRIFTSSGGVALTAYDSSGNESDYTALTVAPEAVPTGLQANADSSSQITVSFTEANAGEDGFIVEYQISGDTVWATGVQTGAFSGSGAGAVTGLAGCTTYAFRVRAFANLTGADPLVSDPSDAVTKATAGTSPSAPANLSGSAPTSSSVSLSWTDTSAGTPCAADSFEIERNGTTIHTTTGPTTNYSDTSVSSGNSYTYRVRALRSGLPSNYSNSVTVKLGGTISDTISGKTHSGSMKSISGMAPNTTVQVTSLGGSVCLSGTFVCNGPGGADTSECNALTDECICPANCANASFGALMREGCVQVSNGSTFNSGSGTVNFFVNGDCNPDNNSGQFTITLTY
ncbi:MAG: fibronectin type III domain-containing protein [Candidatus Schekmanbacteria bacterium]|nr:fibronectin type III domain-containing protein [Candidatus Schekmanbacteria bacterium]